MAEQLSLFNSDRTSRQYECVNKWIENKCRGTLNCAVGFGKTRIGLIAIKRFLTKNPGRSVIIAVPSEPIRAQWLKELETWDLQAEVKTYHDTSKHEYSCDLLVLDEVHRAAANQLISTFDNVKYKIILGLTATFERLDGRDALIAQHCPIVDTVTQQEAISKGWLSEYREYLVLLEPDDIDTYKEYNRQFLEHFAFFDYNFPLAMSVATNWQFRLNYCKEHNLDNKQVIAHAMRFNRMLQARKKYINEHPKKIEIANFILEHRQDKKCITFSNTIAMAEKIKYGRVYSGKDSKKKGRITLSEFINMDAGVINSIRKLNEGFNCPDISVAVILGLDSSKTRKTQSVGRVIRHQEGKTAEVFNLVIKNTVEETWFQNSIGDNPYVTIDEDGLRALLEGREITTKKNKKVKSSFRF